MKRFVFLTSKSKAITSILLLLGLPVFIVGVSSNAGAANNYPQPYDNKYSSPAKAFHEPDGSTVTITSNGAVVKQSPGHTPYREGWVKPQQVNNINSYNQIPKMAYGDKNPYVNNGTSANQSTSTTTRTTYITTTATPTQTTTTYQQPSTTSTTPVTTTAATSTQSLPNTGAGGVLAIGAIATVLGTISHLFYQRFRLTKSLQA
jgi:hypothetical protein